VRERELPLVTGSWSSLWTMPCLHW
jgi:hypothetical protein